MGNITIGTWEFILGFITLISFGINVHQYFRRKINQNLAVGIYSQLWDIIVEIDKGNIKEVGELERLINQVLIGLNSLNRSLSEENIVKPWDYLRKKKYKETIDWEKEKISLKKRLDHVKLEQTGLEQQLSELEKSKNGDIENPLPGKI